MKIKTGLKKALVGGALIASLYLPGLAKDKKPELTLGYTALETAITQEGDVRSRLLTSMSFSIAGIEVGIGGLNELTSLKPSTYFGRNVLTLGPKGASTKALAVLKIDSQGIFDAKYGIRSIGIPEMLGGYGFLDIAVDKDAVSTAMFYGKPLGKGFGVEMLQDFEIPFKGQVFPYTEIQINKDLGDKLMAFARAEIPDFKPAQGIYMAGIALKLQ